MTVYEIVDNTEYVANGELQRIVRQTVDDVSDRVNPLRKGLEFLRWKLGSTRYSFWGEKGFRGYLAFRFKDEIWKRFRDVKSNLGLNDFGYFNLGGAGKITHIDVEAKTPEEAMGKIEEKKEDLERLYGIRVFPEKSRVWGKH